MGRSVKKGPYVQEALYKRVVAMNERTLLNTSAHLSLSSFQVTCRFCALR